MKNSDPEKLMIRLLQDRIRNVGWQNGGNAAYHLAMALLESPSALSEPEAFVSLVPSQFLDENGVNEEQVRQAFTPLFAQVQSFANDAAMAHLPPIIPMDAIDSFARANEVPAAEVAAWTAPLQLLEDDIERFITQIIGQPYRQKDWGGEMDDLFTGQVRLDGVTVATSFMLKGRSVQGVMKPKDLGKNGDQITRMMTQPADLFIVQHVHRIDPSVRQQLENAVVARRAQGKTTVGSIWEGVDIARLGVAYGFLDKSDGSFIPDALTVD